MIFTDMHRVLVPLFAGFEEIEAITIIDVLRRAQIEVVTVSLGDRDVLGAHRIMVMADQTFDQISADNLNIVNEFEAIVLPGGAGTFRMRQDPRIIQLVKDFAQRSKLVAAICAAPTVLSDAGILKDRCATSYPAVRSQMEVAEYSLQSVVIDSQIVTSRGAGTAMAFALKLVELLKGSELANKLAQDMMFSPMS
ncbi:MAG: DJ-1/PfpI family protein [Pseudanabaenaceae cyanobacterium bins.39]|nr:DJ-1/PfpI family protein [Pseudanabaenaceae cyanobacterium bins.39]